MKWKKNILSYLLWIIYTGIVLGGIYFASKEVRQMLYLPEMTEYAIAAVCLLVVGLLSFCINQLVHKKKRIAHQKHVFYWIATVLTGIAGFGVRFYSVSFAFIKQADRPDFFNSAKVITGGKLPELYETGYSFYINFLNKVFFFFGNRQQAASNSQIILWILATILLAVGMRKISGRLASWISVAGMSFLPIIVQETLTITPGMLNLLIWSTGFAAIVGMSKRKHSKTFAIISGLLIGILSFVQPTAFLLLVVYFAVNFPYAYDKEKEATVKENVFCMLGSIIATAAGFWGAFLLYCAADGLSISHVLSDYGKLYQLNTVQIPGFLTGDEFVSVGNLCLFCFAAFGLFNFFYHKKSDYQKPYLILCICGVFFVCTDLPFMKYYSDLFVTAMLLLTTAAGLQGLFGKREEPVISEVEKEKKIKESDTESKKDSEKKELEKKDSEKKDSKIAENVTAGQNEQTGEADELKEENKEPVNKMQAEPVKTSVSAGDFDAIADSFDAPSESYEEIFERYRAASENFKTSEPEQQAGDAEADKAVVDTTEAMTTDKVKVPSKEPEISTASAQESESKADGKNTEAAEKEAVAETNVDAKEAPVELLENPLPLPKKHEKKVMDFKVSDMDDDYDIDISSDDDFDIQ